MHFKSYFKIIFASVLAVSSVGCSDFINGEKNKAEVLEYSDSRLKCLQKLPTQLKNLSIGEASQREIESGFDCATKALRYFNERTYGSVDNAYKVEEIRAFFGKYFLKQNNVTPEFAHELMKIKKAIIGGTTNHLTKDEIIRLVDILNVVRDEVIRLAPHIKILLNQTHQKAVAWESVSAATEQLRLSSKRVLLATQIGSSDYSFDDLKKVLSGFAAFVKGDEAFAPYDRYSEYLPLVEAVKNVLVGRRASFSSVYQWTESLDTFIDLYELILKYHYNLSDLQMNDAAKLRQISQFAGKALNLVAQSHQMKSVGYIPVVDLDILVDQVLPRTPLKVQARSVKKVYRAVLLKMLDPERKMDTRGFLGLERKHMASLQREFNVWRLSQSFIDNAPYGSAGMLNQEQLAAAYDRFDKSYVIEKGLSDDPYEQKALEQAWLDYGDLLKNKMPVLFNAQGQLVISAQTPLMGQNWMSLTKANLMRAMSRMLMIGYGVNTGGRLSEAGMLKDGLALWYDEFREFFLDIGAFDPRSGNSGPRSFMEANFFTFSGNGNEIMDQKETFEFVSTLFAAGLSSSENLQTGLMRTCAVAQKDIFGRFYLKQDCFQKEMKNQFASYFANLPGMVAYVKSLNDKQWSQFFTHLMGAAAVADQKQGYIETANIRTMVTILHYIESLVVLYDADQNQKLSLDEVYAAAPRFLSFLKTVGGTENETLLTEGFAYLVFKGSIPGALELGGFQISKQLGLGEADRMNVVRIFGTLKDQLNKAQK